MGKRSTRNKHGDTKILYKKSQQTLFTHSGTCSALSQLHTRSGILQIKNNLSQHQYYLDGKKVKRDLSTETGICIFRRHYKKKRNRMSNQGGSKSLYSTVNTEIDTIEELKSNTPKNSEFANVHHDITQMIMNNFKYLIDNWIEKYLLDSKDAKEKKESVLYSLLHRTELDKTSTSSSKSTYVLNRERLSQEVKNKKIETAAIKCQFCQNRNWVKRSKECWKESSCHSTPASHKNIKVISTLSIPKNLHRKRGNKDKFSKKITKSKRDVILSINKQNKLLDCSSFDLLTISTKSFTKRCATYDCDGKKKKQKKKRHIVFLPKPFYKSATDSTTDDNKRRECKKPNLDTMPSLMKSIYADDPANITSTDDNIRFFRNDNFTMTDTNDSLLEVLTNKTENKSKNLIDEYESEYLQESVLHEQDISDPMMTIDFMNESLVFSTVRQPKADAVITSTKATAMDSQATTQSNSEYPRRTKSKRKNNKRIAKFHKKDKKFIRISHGKDNHRQNQHLLNHCQNIVKYFTDLGNKTNMKLDIHITVRPVNNLEHKSTYMSKQNLNVYENSKTIIYNVETTTKDKSTISITKTNLNNDNIIIPLLDGAVNQSKYILKSRNCSELNNTCTAERSTITDAKILDDISELRSVIKDLTKAAEAFVRGHVMKETKPSQCDKIPKVESIPHGIRNSKHHVLSRIKKQSKDAKKIDENELYNRLMRKSTSYNIIESESILRVTDMTSAAKEMYKLSKSSKSLPNAVSIIGNEDAYKKKQLAYFYDQCNNKTCVQNISNAVWRSNQGPTYEIDSCGRSECGLSCKSSTAMATDQDDVEKCAPEPPPCRRGGMGFGEGCFYCLLLWIPVIMIASLLYSYVIKEVIYPKTPVLGLRHGPETSTEFFTKAYTLKLSDLGF